MLEVTGNTSEPSIAQELSESQLWSERWNLSPEKQSVLQQLAQFRSNTTPTVSTNVDKTQGNEYAVSLFKQMKIVSGRVFQDQWRDPVYLYSKILLSSLLALLNGISFFDSPLDLQGVTDLLFSIFLATQLFSCNIDQLVIPHFVKNRSLFEARERNSNTYSWVVFIAANVLVEAFWQTIVAVPVFAAWCYPAGLQRNGNSAMGTVERGAVSFLLIWLFNLWSSTISQAFAAGFQLARMAIQIATLFYWLALVFCGILTPPGELVRFWIFLYRVSPITYLLEGLAVAGVSGTQITCSSVETVHIPFPRESSSHTCGEYLAPYASASGGQVMNPLEDLDCQYCPYSDVNSILAVFGMDPKNAWRDVGLMAAYVVFNTDNIWHLLLASASSKPIATSASQRRRCQEVEGAA
ncbi:ABC-2 type transporter-domain-containing protein [Xylaria longipes]|nr:ABC-2 type transporter-domain-containing protein [Xylaria longipes]